MKRVLTLTGCAVAGVIVCGDSACQGAFPGERLGRAARGRDHGRPGLEPFFAPPALLHDDG